MYIEKIQVSRKQLLFTGWENKLNTSRFDTFTMTELQKSKTANCNNQEAIGNQMFMEKSIPETSESLFRKEHFCKHSPYLCPMVKINNR